MPSVADRVLGALAAEQVLDVAPLVAFTHKKKLASTTNFLGKVKDPNEVRSSSNVSIYS